MTGRRIDLVFPRFKLLSGAERMILALAAALARQGHRPRIVCHHFDETCRPLLASGVELIVTGVRLDWFTNRYLNAVFDYARVGTLRRWLDPAADGQVLVGPALRLVPGRRTIPQIYHCFEPPRVLHQDREAVLVRSGAARWILAAGLAIYARVDRHLVQRVPVCTTAPGAFAAQRFRSVYGRSAVPITYGLSRTSLDRHADVTRNPGRLLTVNYLHPRKRVERVISAFAALPRSLPGGEPVTLEVAGDGPERARLEAHAAALGVAERVHFAGFVDEDRLPVHYRAAGCYVHAACDESFGLSVIEAAYCGLPVVAVREGGVVDHVVDGETGLLVAGDAESLAAAIQQVLWREDAGRAMGVLGRAHVAARYSWERGADDLLKALDSVPRR